MLALAFLVMIGVSLLIEGWGEHIDKGLYIFCNGIFRAGGDAEPAG